MAFPSLRSDLQLTKTAQNASLTLAKSKVDFKSEIIGCSALPICTWRDLWLIKSTSSFNIHTVNFDPVLQQVKWQFTNNYTFLHLLSIKTHMLSCWSTAKYVNAFITASFRRKILDFNLLKTSFFRSDRFFFFVLNKMVLWCIMLQTYKGNLFGE
jgi:hypothetical protein